MFDGDKIKKKSPEYNNAIRESNNITYCWGDKHDNKSNFVLFLDFQLYVTKLVVRKKQYTVL